ncbi:redoxin domain-containing protein, partial [Candidatus Desantisbacteria bacterium]|nr:redoxin domain-containing protein [Candidatus Desantisbacteria bacterium]
NLNENAIDFTLRDINGGQVSLSSFKNKKNLAVIFFKVPGLNSVKALAYWQKVYDKYKNDHEFSMISVYCPRTPQSIPSAEMDDLQKIIEEANVKFPVLIDDGLNIFSKYGVISFPSSMVLDTQGVVKYILPGFPTFGAEKDITKNLKSILGIPEEKIAEKKYVPELDAGRNYKLAIAVLQRGNTTKAMEYLNISIQKDPKYPDPYVLMAKLYSQSNKTDKALENYQKALELDSSDVNTLIDYGLLCMEMGMKDDALLQFKNIIEIAPNKSAEAYFGMGTIYLKNEVYDSALSKVMEAIKLYSQQKDMSIQERLHMTMSYINAAEILLKNKKKKEAIEQYKDALKKYEEITGELIKEEQKSMRAN